MVFNDTKNIILSLSVILIALIFGILLSGLFFGPSTPVIIFLSLSPIIVFSLIKPKIPIILLLLTIIFTEFYWVEIMEGYLKPFHLASILLLLTFSVFHIQALKSSRIFLLFTVFIMICLISIAFSADWKDSLRSFILPLILLSIAINTSIALYKKKISEEAFAKMILFGSLLCVGFGLIQMVGYRFGGLLLTLTERQIGQIVIAKRPPSFFTEADTFGKFLAFPFLLLLPFALDKKKRLHKYIRVMVLIIFLGIFLNMTRSAIIGMGVAGILYTFYLFKTKNLTRNVAIFVTMGIMLIVSMPIVLGLTQTVGSHEEMRYRFQTFINPSIALEDESIAYRKRGIEETIEGSFESPEAFLVGHGWGSSIIRSRGEPHDVGGSLLINILYYSGGFALIIYLFICIRIIQISLKMAKEEIDENRRLFAEGTLLSFIGIFAISQFASMWIAPEFWLVIGCAIYLELINRKRTNEDFPHP